VFQVDRMIAMASSFFTSTNPTRRQMPPLIRDSRTKWGQMLKVRSSRTRSSSEAPKCRIGRIGCFHLYILMCVCLPIGIATGQATPVPHVESVLVKYRSEGPHALDSCADQLSSRGANFSDATRDRSDSLDQIIARHGLGRQRALFAVQPGETLHERRSALRSRWSRRTPSGPRTLPSMSHSGTTDLAHWYRIQGSGLPLGELISELREDPHVEWVQPDYALTLDQQSSFDDPFLHSSGAWGQDHPDLWGPERTRATAAWSVSTGEDVVVAVVDTGLDYSHPDIDDNVWINRGEDLDGDLRFTSADLNGIDDDENGFIDDVIGFDFANSTKVHEDSAVADPIPFDDHGHGTHVSGTIAAEGNNGIGIVGIAPEAKIMALKGFAADGSARSTDLWRAVLYAAENGASVINTSWSCDDPCPINPLAESVLEVVESLGAVVVTSAGNRTQDVVLRSPENTSRVITVGSIGVDDQISSFSNRGWLMELVAPGGGPSTTGVFIGRRNILSLRSSAAVEIFDPFVVADDYLRLAGTSMAAPHVTGAVAVLRAARPGLTPRQVRMLLQLSAQDLGRVGSDPNYGAGLLDVAALVDIEVPDLEIEIDRPRPTESHDPRNGPFVLRGSVSGMDLEKVEIAVARGLTGQDFEVLPASATAERGDGVLATWDVRDREDGPYTFRVRARLFDGRHHDQYTVVALERNPPLRLSSGMIDASAVSLSGRTLVWQELEEEAATPTQGVVMGRFPSPTRGMKPISEPAFVVKGPGHQINPILDQKLLVWTNVSSEDGTRSFEWCRVPSHRTPCHPRPLTSAPGRISDLQVGFPWMVWLRDDGERRIVEGCRVAGLSECASVALLDSAAGAWIPVATDGVKLVVRQIGTRVLGLCSLNPGEMGCIPQPLPVGTAQGIVEGVHLDESVIALESVNIEFRSPPSCVAGQSCARVLVTTMQLQACSIANGVDGCVFQPVSPSGPFDSWHGVSLSGRRLAWALAQPDEESAIYFCELREDLDCRVQRVSGSLAPQLHPSMDGHRLAWEDRGESSVLIRGIALPRVFVRRIVRAKAGKTFKFLVRGSPGNALEGKLELEGISGVSPVEADVQIQRVGPVSRSWFLVRGRLPVRSVEVSQWRVRFITSGALVAESRIEIQPVSR
jgi:subtilisin family serine protease